MAITNEDKSNKFGPISVYVCNECGSKHGFSREPENDSCREVNCLGKLIYKGSKRKKEVITK